MQGPATVRRLIKRLRAWRLHHRLDVTLLDLLETAAATLEHQADVIAATRCDCARAREPSTNPPNSSHGHVTPRPDGLRARCGGPAICSVCAQELAALNTGRAP